MRRLFGVGYAGVLAILVTSGCVIPTEEVAMPPSAQVLPADARALAYGRTVNEVFQNPEVKDKIRALFGEDWAPASQGRGLTAHGAPAYFEKSGPLRMVRVGAADYIAIDGCQPSACRTKRGLILIREGGAQLLAGIDDGGLSHYYGYGGGAAAVSTEEAQRVVTAAQVALEGLGGP